MKKGMTMVDTKTTTCAETERLFADFPAPNLEQWREEVIRLLKGAPFDKKMLTQTYEGITLQPIYTPEDVKGLPHLGGVPGAFPFVRGNEALGKRVAGWWVAQELPYPKAREFNEALKNDLERGQTAVNLVLDAASMAGLDPDLAEASQVGAGGTSISSVADVAVALQGVDLKAAPLYLASGSSALAAAALVVSHLKTSGQDLKALSLSLGFDPLGSLAGKGSLPMPLEQAYNELAELTRFAIAESPLSRTMNVCGHPYHEAGANAVQELAFSLADAVALLRAMEVRGLDVDVVAPRIQFRFSVGGQFFMEIAKLRAARLLWAQVVKASGGKLSSAKMALHARSGRFNKTQFDPHVNLLRNTTEAFSAVVGGADSLHVAAFDEVLGGAPSDLGRRIARNTQLMLREESKLDHVVDLGGGSWYIERLTHEVAQAAWKLFQEVEAMDGFAKALEAGFVQAKIAEVAAARRKAIVQRQDVIVGTNQYANALEAMPETKVTDHAALKAELGPKAAARRGAVSTGKTFAELLKAAPTATLGQLVSMLGRDNGICVTPLQAHRAAEVFETLRKAVLAYRATHQGPQVFLANLGPVGAYMPRLDFTRGFFQVGGFEVADQASFNSPEEAAAAALASGAGVVVIVGLDDTYVAQAPAVAKALKAAGKAPVVLVAGLLKDHAEAFKAAGVDEFIHVKSDVHAVLSGLAQTLEVF